MKIQNFSFMKMHLKLSFAKWRPFCPGGDELTNFLQSEMASTHQGLIQVSEHLFTIDSCVDFSPVHCQTTTCINDDFHQPDPNEPISIIPFSKFNNVNYMKSTWISSEQHQGIKLSKFYTQIKWQNFYNFPTNRSKFGWFYPLLLEPMSCAKWQSSQNNSALQSSFIIGPWLQEIHCALCQRLRASAPLTGIPEDIYDVPHSGIHTTLSQKI